MTVNDDLPKADERSIAVRLRANEQCMICHRTSAQTTLQVHAIVPGDEEASRRLSNFVLLCEDHHQKAHQARAN